MVLCLSLIHIFAAFLILGTLCFISLISLGMRRLSDIGKSHLYYLSLIHICNVDAAKAVGVLVGKRALEKGIVTVVFDRGGYIYHGRVQALAEGAREAGLKF